MSLRNKVADLLKTRLDASEIEVVDESAGHAGHSETGAHFFVHIVSPKFNGKTRIERHQMVYEALKDELRENVHALRIRALSTED